MAGQLDFVKEYTELYKPGAKPVQLDVPAIPFFMVDGKGAPGGDVYQRAVGLLYALSYSIKMSKMKNPPEGYVEYAVPPLEGFWDCDPLDTSIPRSDWTWTMMLRQPDFVTTAVFEWAEEEVRKKKPELDTSLVRFARLEEGLCVQAMHNGPYSAEPETVATMHAYMQDNGLALDFSDVRRHHEIYLKSPLRTKPENLKTILRLPVRPI